MGAMLDGVATRGVVTGVLEFGATVEIVTGVLEFEATVEIGRGADGETVALA